MDFISVCTTQCLSFVFLVILHIGLREGVSFLFNTVITVTRATRDDSRDELFGHRGGVKAGVDSNSSL